MTNVGEVLTSEGKLGEARKTYEDALAIRRRLAAADSHNALHQGELAAGFTKRGEALRAVGQLAEALRAYEDALAIRRRLAETDLTNNRIGAIDARINLRIAIYALAHALGQDTTGAK